MASHRSAALLWGHEIVGDRPIDVIGPGRSGLRHLPGVVHHRPTDLIDLRSVMRHGIPCTNPLRCLCDLGAVAPHEVDALLTHLRIDGIVTLAAAEAAAQRHQGRGRSGVVALRKAIAAQALREAPPDSVLEEAMARLSLRYRLPRLVFHARLEGYEVDFWVEDTPLVVECEGWSVHGRDPEQFEYDKRRCAALVAAGYVILPITWAAIQKDPAGVASTIRRAMSTWSLRSRSDL